MNIITAKHLLDEIQATPELNKVKELLTAAAVQTKKMDPLSSISRIGRRTHSRHTDKDRSCYDSSNDRRSNKDDPETSNDHQASSYNLCHKVKKKDARSHLNTIREECDAKYDDIKAFSDDIRKYKYPSGFKPSIIDKYDGKADPKLWLRCYSAAIEASGGNDKSKILYFARGHGGFTPQMAGSSPRLLH